MSTPFPIYRCSQCDFHDNGISFWGQINYHTRLGPLPVERQPGWCADCGGVEPIEVLPEESVAERDTSDADKPDAGEVVASGVTHPGCGGEIMISTSEVWASFDIPARMFDTLGRKIPLVDPREQVPRSIQGDLFETDGETGEVDG